MIPFPEFKITNSEKRAGRIVLNGILSSTKWGNDEWVSDGSSGCIIKNREVIFGYWRALKNGWEFTFDKGEKGKLNLISGETFDVIDGYWGEKAELVYDKTMKWNQYQFVETDRRDHDHCSICWDTISVQRNTAHYKISSHSMAICESCFVSYVQPESLAFVYQLQQKSNI